MNYLKTRPKEGHGYIYRYTSPSGKSYIGQTIRSLSERYDGGRGYKNCTIFNTALEKYGVENFIIEILEECRYEEMDDKEYEYIEILNTQQPNGYNIRANSKDEYYIRNTRKTKVKKYDSKGNFITEYDSLQEAASDNDTIYQAISAVVRKIRPHHKGFIYRYSSDNDPIEEVKITKTHGRLTAQYDLEEI